MSSASTGSNLRSTVSRSSRSCTLVDVKYGLDPPPAGTNSACGSKPPQVAVSVPPGFGPVAAAAVPTMLDANAAPAVVIRNSRLENLLIAFPSLPMHRTGPRLGVTRPCDRLFCIQRRIGAAPDREQRTLFIEHIDIGDADALARAAHPRHRDQRSVDRGPEIVDAEVHRRQ